MPIKEETTVSPAVAITNGTKTQRVSRMASALIGSEILRIAADIRALEAKGETICNLTVGDFSPKQFRIPKFFEDSIVRALWAGETNYPPSDGMPALRKSVQKFYSEWLGLEYPIESIIAAGGVRPVIYASYRTLIDPGDEMVYPVPSWNNNHYIHLVSAKGIPVICPPETSFLPTRELLEPVIRNAKLLVLNSPLNPSGTAFPTEVLADICDLVLEENDRRGKTKPLFLLYDQVYWMLTFGGTKHCDPVTLRPEMRDYTIFLDGISKAFAATGVRVGWAVGPADIMKPMSNIIGHMGAWAPRAEQVATAELLDSTEEIKKYHSHFMAGVQQRLDALYRHVTSMKKEGFPVAAIHPQGAIYLSVKFDVIGKRGGDTVLKTNDDIRKYLLDYAGFAVVPFQAFGLMEDTGWFRLSVGAVSVEDINAGMLRVRKALSELH